MDALILTGLAGFSVGGIVVGLIVYFWRRQCEVRGDLEHVTVLKVHDEARQEAERRCAAAMTELRVREAESRTRLESERQRVVGLEEHYRKLLDGMKAEFKALSGEVLAERRAELERAGVTSYRTLTDPLLREVRSFRERVDRVNSEDGERTAQLRADIENLLRQTSLVSEQADRLSSAIRADAQVTGQWGEIQLRRVLELGGLEETVDYTYQETFVGPHADHANLRTDVLVKMPGDRWLVIDAKTTMAAYVDYVGDGGGRNADVVPRIVASLVSHVKEMKSADYSRNLAATTGRILLPTMLMYIPFEEVYLIAMKAEIPVANGKMPLRDWAWQNGVTFVSAAGLIPVVRMLAELWARNRAEKKIMEIKGAAEALIEKFNVFLSGKDGFAEVGRALKTAVKAYNASVSRLSEGKGNVIRRLGDLREMGVSAANLPGPEAVENLKLTAGVAVSEEPENGIA